MARHEGKMDMQTIKDIYKKAGTPGEHHKLLARLEGSWITKTRGWMEPGKPPVESEGTCEQKMILEGHYLQQSYAGDNMMGKPFTGINLVGYNNHTEKYTSVWIDSRNTGIYFFEGPASADGRTITQHCSYDDPVRGPSDWRSVIRFKDDNTIEYEMHVAPRGGREEKMMEMTLSRKAAASRKAA